MKLSKLVQFLAGFFLELTTEQSTVAKTIDPYRLTLICTTANGNHMRPYTQTKLLHYESLKCINSSEKSANIMKETYLQHMRVVFSSSTDFLGRLQ